MLQRLEQKTPKAIYSNEKFRHVLEDHLELIANAPGTRRLKVEPKLAYRHESNFTALLNELGVDSDYHWITMRLNKMRDPREYREHLNVILLPDINLLGTIEKTFRNHHK